MNPNETRILIADDSQVALQLLSEHLRSIGFEQILQAENGEHAFQILEEQLAQNTPIQLLISDLNMPVVTGSQLIQKIRESEDFKNLPAIILSVQADRVSIIDAVLKGSSSYLLKPPTKDGLQEKIEFVWKKHGAAS